MPVSQLCRILHCIIFILFCVEFFDILGLQVLMTFGHIFLAQQRTFHPVSILCVSRVLLSDNPRIHCIQFTTSDINNA